MLQDAGSESFQVLFLAEKRVGRFDDFFEAVFALFDSGDVTVGAEGAFYRGVELHGGKLRLFFVVVDLIVVDHLLLGSLPRLPGAQDDADFVVL